MARNLANEGKHVTVVTKDLPLRLKASIVGLPAEEYRNELARDTSWTGLVELEVDSATIDDLFDLGSIDDDRARDLPCHTGVVLHAGSQSALARVHPDKALHLVRRDGHLFDVRGRSAEQRIAIDLLADPSIGIVSLGGPAGTGKSVLALAAGLESVLEQRTHKRVLVFRPLYAVGGQDLGYLPGSELEKMNPWTAAVLDGLESITGPEVIDEVMARGLLEVLPLTHIRGRSLNDSFVIVDEAQNLERPVLLTALSRLGHGQPGRAHPRRRPARQPAGGPPRRRGVGDRGAQGPPDLRPRHPHPLRAQRDRRAWSPTCSTALSRADPDGPSGLPPRQGGSDRSGFRNDRNQLRRWRARGGRGWAAPRAPRPPRAPRRRPPAADRRRGGWSGPARRPRRGRRRRGR